MRQDANRLIERIMTRHEDANEWVLTAYSAGRALALVGDESDVRTLEAFQQRADVPPNVRFWLSGVAESVENSWNKRAEDWPEPSAHWRGVLEQVEAELVVATERISVRLSLWRRDARGDEERQEWGAGIWTLGAEAYRLALASHDDEIEIWVNGRPTARAWIEAASAKRVLLRGNGPYPEVPTP